jgi:hypothetical protein
MTGPVDVAAIKAEHQPHPFAERQYGNCATCNDGYDIAWPCETYRLAEALERAQAASEGVDMLLAQAERRGAVKALRDAARQVYNGAPNIHNRRGDFNAQALYNEGASPWLDGIADGFETGETYL